MEPWLILMAFAIAVVIALAVDHPGLLGLEARPINSWRATGAALMLLGVTLWLLWSP